MAGHQPLHIANQEEVAKRLSDTFWHEPLQVRNEFANGLLAWAELQDEETYDVVKRLVIDTEYALSIKEWTRKDPSMDKELALAKLAALTVELVRTTADPSVDGTNYHECLGPDIPIIIRQAFDSLYEGHQNS
jgi:hypothetical protein